MIGNMKIFNAIVTLAFCKVVAVAAADIDKNPEPQDQEPNVLRGLYKHSIIGGVTHIDTVQSGQITREEPDPVAHQPLNFPPPPPVMLPYPVQYGHYMPPPYMAFDPWRGPIVHPLPYGHHVPAPMIFYPWPVPMFHPPMLPPPQYFGPPPPYEDEAQQAGDRDEGYTSDPEEEDCQQHDDFRDGGYTSGQETVVDDGSIDGLSEEDDLPQILKEIEAFGKGEKTPLELLSEALTSWERDS